MKLLQAEVQENALSQLIDHQVLQTAAALWHKLVEGVRWWFTHSGS